MLVTIPLGGIHWLRGQDEGKGGQKVSVFVQAQGVETVHAGLGRGGGDKKWQNSVHEIVEFPLSLLIDVEIAEKFLLGHYCLVVFPLLFFCIIKT